MSKELFWLYSKINNTGILCPDDDKITTMYEQSIVVIALLLENKYDEAAKILDTMNKIKKNGFFAAYDADTLQPNCKIKHLYNVVWVGIVAKFYQKKQKKIVMTN